MKELRKVIAVLVNDCLIKSYQQNELNEDTRRVVSKRYYYIDYGNFCMVVRWRIQQMWRNIDSKPDAVNGEGYSCPNCKTSYTLLDLSQAIDPIEADLFARYVVPKARILREDYKAIQSACTVSTTKRGSYRLDCKRLKEWSCLLLTSRLGSMLIATGAQMIKWR
ncbi:hypothetical protein GYMLUDRAFT_45107 [Collybiopsis luxurians FD-317 M1]|uniref:TFIIEalpha/SarR/Rpc3 HTH domain-containing protein n=1 Tax=Collybiopsis luxurians FD-317 M1 TaxID=944289 RepID=A0A0D0B603_9AGAR|nr:hypothetical protein GYMLUDRAFT_45107 [Collybiopsis luxurians FD-317 M1]